MSGDTERLAEKLAARLALLRCQDFHGLDYGYVSACHACENWGKYAAERLAPTLRDHDAEHAATVRRQTLTEAADAWQRTIYAQTMNIGPWLRDRADREETP